MDKEYFERLMKMAKKFEDEGVVIPKLGMIESLKVLSEDGRETFYVDCDRKNRIELKVKNQNRHSSNTVLFRVEVNCPPHLNPDGTLLSRNHVHIFTEEYGESFAVELDEFHPHLFKKWNDFNSLFEDFCEYSNIEVQSTQLSIDE